MDEAQASGHVWREDVRRRCTVEQDRAALARLIAYDADPFEVQLYEWASEPRHCLSIGPNVPERDSTPGTYGG